MSESEKKYRELVENANSIILKLDTKGNVTFINEFAQDFFGYKDHEITGRNAIDTIVPAADSYNNDLSAMIQDICGNPWKYATNENENMKRSGERVWVAWTNKGIYENGRLAGVLCIGFDTITDIGHSIEQAAILTDGEIIGPGHLNICKTSGADGFNEEDGNIRMETVIPKEKFSLDSAIDSIVQFSLQRCGNNKSLASEILKINRKMFYRRGQG